MVPVLNSETNTGLSLGLSQVLFAVLSQSYPYLTFVPDVYKARCKDNRLNFTQFPRKLSLRVDEVSGTRYIARVLVMVPLRKLRVKSVKMSTNLFVKIVTQVRTRFTMASIRVIEHRRL